MFEDGHKVVTSSFTLVSTRLMDCKQRARTGFKLVSAREREREREVCDTSSPEVVLSERRRFRTEGGNEFERQGKNLYHFSRMKK